MNKLQWKTAGRARLRLHTTDFTFARKRYRVSLDGHWTSRRATSIAAAANAFALKQAQKKPEFVYFMECDERIKIGITRDPNRRLRSLQTGNPSQLRILAIVAGDADLEQAIHAKFESTRIGGDGSARPMNLLNSSNVWRHAIRCSSITLRMKSEW